MTADKRTREAAATASGAEGGLSSTSGHRVSNTEKTLGRAAEFGLRIRSKLGKQEKATGTAKEIARRIKKAGKKEKTWDAEEEADDDEEHLSAEEAVAPYSPQF